MKTLTTLLLALLIFGCAFNISEIGRSQAAYSNFFLCFPNTDIGFSKLHAEEQLIIMKGIANEKRIRNFNCDEFSNFASTIKNVDDINREILMDKSQPCRRPNLNNCEAR